MRILIAALLPLTACPAPPVAPAVAEQATEPIRQVTSAVDIAGAAGARATVTGTVRRIAPDGVEGQGTAVVLDDGTAIYVSEGEPPAGWDWLVSTRVRVQGSLWETPAEGWPVPTLANFDSPMPADVAMPMLAPSLPE